jgi:Hypothetical glycosyl hydrolase family 15
LPFRSFLYFWVLCCGVLPAFSQEQSRAHFFPDTTDNIHLEMVFNYSVPDPNVETGVVDMVWGSDFTTPAGVYNTAYIPYSVDNFTRTVAWYKKHHPDWLEYQCDRKTLAFEFGTTSLAPLDVTNPAVREFQWSNWVDAPLAQGYSGIAIDTLTLTNDWKRCGHYAPSGEWVRQYSGGPNSATFRRNVLNWEAATYRHVHQLNPTATMQVNYSYQSNQPVADNLAMMTTADLLFDERGYTQYGTLNGNVPSPAEWATITNALSYTQSKGVCYMTNGEEPELTSQISQEERLWVIANYLLVKNNCTYMYMTGFSTNGGQDYGTLVQFPEYSIPIGHATGERVKRQGVWMRAYSGGLTLVNPYNRTAIVRLPAGNWNDVNGNPVDTEITMRQQTGVVLLSQ